MIEDLIESINDIILKWQPCEDDDEETKASRENDIELITKEAKDMLDEKDRQMGGIEYASVNKMLALSHFKLGEEISAICRLIESHAVILRQQILHRYVKTGMHETFLNTSQSYGLKPAYKYVESEIGTCEGLISVLSELPKEWYMIQVTARYQPDKPTDKKSMHPVHIAVLPTGDRDSTPLSITLPKPETSNSFDVCYEIQKLLSNNRGDLEASYANNELYWKMRVRQNNALKETIKELEYTWLREWRILFMADPTDDSELVQSLTRMIAKLLSDSNVSQEISERSKWLLRKIVLGAVYLTREEIARAVKYAIPKHSKLARNVILSIYGKLLEMEELKSARRKTLVFILDEHMDYIPFESMDVLKSHPATRFPSLHVAYALFKEHESSMEDGCKVIKVKHDMGTCIVNPSGTLAKMEKRMKLFINYWLPNWRSWYSAKPEEELFEDALVNGDILMYNGHGSGIQYLAGEHIERLRVKSIVLLFGCSSVKLLTVGGRYPPYGVSNQYLIASSPCVLGMLWEVTDADIDKMTANFISSWIPSTSERPWCDFDVNAWCMGTLRCSKNQAGDTPKVPIEPEMLRAVAKSKDVCCHLMTAAAIVVRGLPIKLV